MITKVNSRILTNLPSKNDNFSLKMKILKFFGIQPNYWIAIQNEGYYSYASDSDFGGMDTDQSGLVRVSLIPVRINAYFDKDAMPKVIFPPQRKLNAQYKTKIFSRNQNESVYQLLHSKLHSVVHSVVHFVVHFATTSANSRSVYNASVIHKSTIHIIDQGFHAFFGENWKLNLEIWLLTWKQNWDT